VIRYEGTSLLVGLDRVCDPVLVSNEAPLEIAIGLIPRHWDLLGIDLNTNCSHDES
jgi:hypothetical protein